MPDLEGLTYSDPEAFVEAGDELNATAQELEGAASGFQDAIDAASRHWVGDAQLAQFQKGMGVFKDLGRAADAMRWAETAARDGGKVLQSIVVGLRAMVQAALDSGFLVLMPTGFVQPGPALQASAAAEGPGAPAAWAAYISMAAVMTTDIDAGVLEANAIDAQVAAQINAAADLLAGKVPAEGMPGGPGLFQPLTAQAWKTMTPEAIAMEIQKRYGMPIANQEALQKFVDKEGVIVDVRPTNPDSVAWLAKGALPKPYLVKAKTINSIDVLLGAPADRQGTVGFFVPDKSTLNPADYSPGDWAAIEKRFKQRSDEQTALAQSMADLTAKGSYRVNGGVVEGLDANGVWQPVTGDHDIYNVRTPFGDQLPGGEYPQNTSDGAYNQLMQRMVDQHMGVMHGAHAYWRPAPGFETDNVYMPIVRGHRIGAEELVRFSPLKPPTVVYNVSPVDLP